MPTFEEFSREDSRASREGPMFTLQARGLISFNQAAFTALGEPAAVALLYDATEGVVAMRNIPSSHRNAHKVRKQQQAQSYLVGAQSFVTHYKIPAQRALRFPGHDYGDGAWGFALREGTVVQNRRGRHPRSPVTDRWRRTNDGAEVPELMRITHVGMSHPGYHGRQPGNTPPSVRVGMLLACSPLTPEQATSKLRSGFLDLLGWAPVMEFITAMSHVDTDMTWTPWGGHGRISFEAVLAGGAEQGTPLASALLRLPEERTSTYGRDVRFAELVLHLEPRTSEGTPASPANLAAWHDRFSRALRLPAVLTRFLTEELKLNASDDPPAQVGVWLTAPHSISEMVDIEQLVAVQGATSSPQFVGWALAEPGGDPVQAVAADWLTEMCDNALQLDGYEPVLERMRSGRKDDLRIGEQLTVGQSLYSADGRFRFEVQEDANLVVYWGRVPLWKSDTARIRGAYYLALQADGDLGLYDADNAPIWSTGTAGQGGESLLMQQDGNLVLYSKKGAVWSSGVTAR